MDENQDQKYNHQDETEFNWNFEQYENIKSEEKGKEKKPKKKGKGLIVFGCIIGALVIIGATIAGTFIVSRAMFENMDQSEKVEKYSDGKKDEANLYLRDKPQSDQGYGNGGMLTTEQIVEKVSPSVVGIVSYSQSGNLFTSKIGEGSGIIMREDGYIITNAHVIAGGDGFKVVLANGEEYAADIVGMDIDTDLAVIKIDANNLSFAEFGDSDQVKVGERAIAIGNPSGLSLAGSTTQGIISAKERQITTDSGITVSCLQTDAAINPGNSGGALVNAYGQVIGITSSKIVAEGFEGIGFAIPTAYAEPVINDIITHGYVKGRVKLGVVLEPIDEILAAMNHVPTGLYVRNVESGSGAAKGGIVPGDIITHVDGERVNLPSDIKDMLHGYKPGDTVTLTVFRRTTGYKDKTLELKVVLSEAVSK